MDCQRTKPAVKQLHTLLGIIGQNAELKSLFSQKSKQLHNFLIRLCYIEGRNGVVNIEHQTADAQFFQILQGQLKYRFHINIRKKTFQ